MCSNPNDFDRAEKRVFLYVFFLPPSRAPPSLPGALTPIIPIHHEKMNRQVEKEKKKKGKRKKKKGKKKAWAQMYMI